MTLNPLHDRVVLKRVDNERKTTSGIVIPDSAAEKSDQAEVVAVGPGARDANGQLLPMSVKVGDRVVLGKYAGQAVKLYGEELLILREEEILAIVA